ncbi:MAG TPA: tRNA pseudouridine(55) synthase TruB [Dehalococcoidales bacterium]|nr:tRNA pseudouridine(55) synthase TruB [Dehalococcoidales bacterium]
MDGILNINKPSGMTSFAVVAKIRHFAREKRVGHAGTLDPLASGVLPVYLGQATRLIEYAGDTTKTYHAEIEFGAVTTTFDAEGEVTSRTDTKSLERETIERALGKFVGEISQVPPVYSALKQQGTPLYRLARAGVEVTPQARMVKIDRLVMTEWSRPIATVEVDCSKGTYIRSLAHDLGTVTGFGAYLKSLVRTRCGGFNIANSITLDGIVTAFTTDTYRDSLFPIDCMLSNLPRVEVDDATATNIKNGIGIALPGILTDGICRAYIGGGTFLSILRFDAEQTLWHPEKVFHSLDTTIAM